LVKYPQVFYIRFLLHVDYQYLFLKLFYFQILVLKNYLLIKNYIDLIQDIFLMIKICIFVVLFCWIRAALPRYRYDQLMNLGWKTFLPISLGWLLFTASVLISFNWLPY